LHIRFCRIKDWLKEQIKVPGNLHKAVRLEVFYGLHELPIAERVGKLTYLLEGKRFIHANPDVVCCPALMLLISKTNKKRFFHPAILESVNHFLFSNSQGLGYKVSSEDKRMLDCIPAGIIAWICLLVTVTSGIVC
jgi:hypothetical protein